MRHQNRWQTRKFENSFQAAFSAAGDYWDCAHTDTLLLFMHTMALYNKRKQPKKHLPLCFIGIWSLVSNHQMLLNTLHPLNQWSSPTSVRDIFRQVYFEFYSVDTQNMHQNLRTSFWKLHSGSTHVSIKLQCLPFTRVTTLKNKTATAS